MKFEYIASLILIVFAFPAALLALFDIRKKYFPLSKKKTSELTLAFENIYLPLFTLLFKSTEFNTIDFHELVYSMKSIITKKPYLCGESIRNEIIDFEKNIYAHELSDEQLCDLYNNLFIKIHRIYCLYENQIYVKPYFIKTNFSSKRPTLTVIFHALWFLIISICVALLTLEIAYLIRGEWINDSYQIMMIFSFSYLILYIMLIIIDYYKNKNINKKYDDTYEKHYKL